MATAVRTDEDASVARPGCPGRQRPIPTPETRTVPLFAELGRLVGSLAASGVGARSALTTPSLGDVLAGPVDSAIETPVVFDLGPVE